MERKDVFKVDALGVKSPDHQLICTGLIRGDKQKPVCLAGLEEMNQN